MINILVLSVGTNACFHFVKTLKKFFSNSFYIVGTDINESYLVASSVYIDKFYKVPYSNDPSYYNIIINICKENNIQYILPSLDQDQLLFYPENPDLVNNKIISLGTNKETQKYYHNKLEMYEFLKHNSFPLPKIYKHNECDDNTKYIIKPIDGYGSLGVQILMGSEIKLKSDISNYIIQDICENPEITVEYFHYNSFFAHICRERIATKAGVCTKAKVFQNDDLASYGKLLANLLVLPYFFNIQFMKYNGKYVITDVNLRMAGGVSIASNFNWDYIQALGHIMLKDDYDLQAFFPEIRDNNYVVRMYEDVVTTQKKQKDVIAFDLDGTIIDSRKRHSALLNDILKSKEIHIPLDDLIEFKRNGKNNIDYLVSKGIDEKTAQDVQKEWVEHIEDIKYIDIDTLYDDSISLLEKNSNNRIIAITARKNKANVYYQLYKLGIIHYFSDICIVTPGKSAQADKQKYIEDNNVKVLYGDTLIDYRAAKACNIKFIYRSNGFHSIEYINSVE